MIHAGFTHDSCSYLLLTSKYAKLTKFIPSITPFAIFSRSHAGVAFVVIRTEMGTAQNLYEKKGR